MKKFQYEFSFSGTLGDTFIAVLKLMRLGNLHIKVYHFTKCKFWENEIREIYSLMPNVEVEFVPKKVKTVPILSSKAQELDWFPNLKVDGKFPIAKPYIVIHSHSGKPEGGNTKELRRRFIRKLIYKFNNEGTKVVLLGTKKEKYSEIDNCVNLVGKTSVLDNIPIIARSNFFIGPEGLLSFVALSQRVQSAIYYTSQKAVDHRIIGTPWEIYANLKKVKI